MAKMQHTAKNKPRSFGRKSPEDEEPKLAPTKEKPKDKKKMLTKGFKLKSGKKEKDRDHY